MKEKLIPVPDGMFKAPVEKQQIEIDYYESDALLSGSVAVLKDGRRLLTEAAWNQLREQGPGKGGK